MSEDKKKVFPRDWTDYFTGGGTDWTSAIRDLQGANWERSRKDNVSILMEHYCFLVKHGREVPRGLQVYIATAFWKYLEKGKKLETAFELKEERKGRKATKGKREHPYFPNDEVMQVLNHLARKGCTMYRATELVHRTTKKPISTIRDMCSDAEMEYATPFMVQMYEESTGERIPKDWIPNLKKSKQYYKNVSYEHYEDTQLSEIKMSIQEYEKRKSMGTEPDPKWKDDEFPF